MSITKSVYDNVWSEQGFFLLDVGVVDSRTLRKNMFDLKENLSEFIRLGFYSMSRFNQQETTPYHQDGGPESNVLMIGYEPSNVKSQLFIKNEFDFESHLSLTPNDHSFILIVNNSKKGIFHKAIIQKDNNEKRIINSIMLIVGEDQISIEEQQNFLITDKIY
jgi:hypothetical protein